MKKDQPQPEDHAEIFRLWSMGLSPHSLSRVYGVDVSEVDEIVHREAAKLRLPSDQHPETNLREHRLRMNAMLDEYAALAPKVHDAARVRTIDGRVRILKHLFEVNQQLGLVPDGSRQLAFLRDGLEMANQMMKVLDDHGVLTDEVLEGLGREFVPDWDEVKDDYVPPLDEPPPDGS